MRVRKLPIVPVLVAMLSAGLLSGCSGSGGDGPDRRAEASASISAILGEYTDPGDGCEQSVSAISYAETRLKALGQERYQDWDDATLSYVAAVAGTIELEMADYPDDVTAEQARVVADLATVVVDPETSEDERLVRFREYRREAADLVIVCAEAVDGI